MKKMNFLQSTIKMDVVQKELKPCPFCGVPIILYIIKMRTGEPYNFSVKHYRDNILVSPPECIVTRLNVYWPVDQIYKFKDEWNTRMVA